MNFKLTIFLETKGEKHVFEIKLLDIKMRLIELIKIIKVSLLLQERIFPQSLIGTNKCFPESKFGSLATYSSNYERQACCSHVGMYAR